MMDTTRHMAAGLLPGDVASMTDDAVEQLDKHQLADAERLFHRVLQAGVDDSVTEAKCAITCLLGLGQLYMKQARSQRHVELEWHRVCLQAIASLQLATELCDDVASRYLDTDLQLWLTQNRNKAAGHRKVLESIILKSLLQKFADKGKCKQETFDCSWLATLRAHYKSKAQQFLTKAMFSSSDESGTDDEAPAEERKTTAAKQDKLSKVDFNKLHKVIQNLVKQISADMRRRYLRKKLSEKTLRRSISSELIAMPQEDILTLFEEAIIPDEPDSESNNQKVTAPATPSNDSRLSMDSVLEHQENDGKLDHTEATHSASHDSETTTATIVKPEVSSARRCHENGGDGQHECSTTTDATASVAEEVDSKEVQNSVLSAWRRYKEQCPLRLPAPPYHPPGSVATTPTIDMAVTLVGSPPSSPRGVAPLIKSPLSDSVLDQALANMLIHVADKLHEGGDETKLHIAYELYNYALAMYQETGFSTAHALVVGRVLKQLGLIDCQRGDLAAGSEIVHEAIELLILANTGSADDPLDVSRAWFQLGNAYVENHCREGALLFHILELVKREIEMPDVDENAANADSSKSDLTNIHEAIACYNRALAIVSLLRRQNKCCHTQFYVSVLTKLGDCSIIVGGSGRDRSVLCYEEALCLSKYTFGSASLRDNAHILSMLGMSNFLLEHYPKAVSMFETANVLQQHCCGGDDADFETAFNRTMLAICHYVTKYYYKCVVWCLRAFEVYDLLYVNKLKSIPPLKRWFIVRTLYTLGYSYSTLNFNCKALHYLELCRHIISQTNEPPERRDVPHLVRVLKVTGDIYASTDELHLAGEYYTEALESCALLGGAHNSTNALHNQLLNCLASVHVTTKEYSSAAEYLEQALSHQKNVQSHIASDLVGLLGQLARTYTLAGDVDRAIECASECIDAYDDKSSAGVRSKAQQLCSLATLYYVEACLSDDIDFDEELGMRSERCFKQACRLCPDSVVSVQYANFLYQRGDDARALIAMLPFIYDDGIRHLAGEKRNVAYIGVEQAILPEHLHHELDDIDESVLDALVFGRFLAILCYKQLYLEKDAEDCLNELAAIVSESPVALNHAILAYSYMELAMFEKAAISFAHAAFLKCDNSLALTNFWICCCLSAFQGITNAMFAVYASTRVEPIAVAPVGGIPMYDEPAAPIAMKDSGYYDSAVELSEHLPPEESLSHVTGAVGGRSGTRERFSCVEEISSNEMMESLMEEKFDGRTSSLVDLGYTSNEYLAQESATSNHETHQGWTSGEVLVNSQKVSKLNVTEQRHCDIPVSERSKTYQYEMKMSVSPSDHGYLNVEHLPEASPPQFSPTRLEHEEAGDGNADDDVFNEWWSEEVVVETPPEVLDMIRQRNMAKESTSSVDSEESPGKNMAESPTEVDEEFTVWEVEETVQTPAAILQVIQQQQQQQHQLLQSQYEVTCNFTISSQKAGIVVDNNNLHLAQHHTAIEFGKTNNSNEVWIEETVNPATTMAILNYVNGNGQHTSSTPDEQNGNLNTSRGENEREEDGVEESNEVWETWEETVETPPEILRAIMANQHC